MERGRREDLSNVAYLHIFKTVLLTYASQDIFLAAFLQFAGQKEFIQDEVCFLEIEYNVQLAHVSIVFVHLLDITMNDLEGDQFVISRIAPRNEEERGIATVDDLGV